MRDKSFDFMVKHRIWAPKADQDIVIVDINEASLAAFAKEYGRWPWPRQVLGEFVENIQTQKPKAIVFDIVFSDADIYNADSDAYFNDVIANTENTFFPILRLDASQDSSSKLKLSQIPGLRPVEGSKEFNRNATVAVVLPHFEGALKANRLGTNNIYPDSDGIVREYKLWNEEHGWLLPALPFVIGEFAQSNPLPIPQNMLINWRGAPFSYTYVSFSDAFTDMTSKLKKRPQNEFTDKIVIIGSTATGLFDIKPTAIDKQFPGVEILATAIDNVKHRDYLKVLRGKTPYILLSLLLIWLTTLAFYINVDRDKFNSVFTGSQIGLLVLSYIGINLSNTYLDLSGPILWAVTLFSISKVYALATDRALQRWLAFGIKSNTAESIALLMPILVESNEALTDALLKKLKRGIELVSDSPSRIDIVSGTQGGIWGLFGDMVVVSWQFANNKPEYIEAAKLDAQNIGKQLSTLVANIGLPNSTITRYVLHEGKLSNIDGLASSLASQWRLLFAQAVLKLEHNNLETLKDLA